jgi:hypothetical protein
MRNSEFEHEKKHTGISGNDSLVATYMGPKGVKASKYFWMMSSDGKRNQLFLSNMPWKATPTMGGILKITNTGPMR